MKSYDSQSKGPSTKGSSIKCKSRSTSSDGEVDSSSLTNQQSRPDSHQPHSNGSNEVSMVRFEQIDPVNGPSNASGVSSCGSSSFYTPNSKLMTAVSTYGPSPAATSNIVVNATTPSNPTTIIASAIPHRTRHPSLNSTLGRFSLRRFLSSFGESTQTSPVSSASTSVAPAAVTLSTGPAGKVSGGRNPISVDSHTLLSDESSVSSKGNHGPNHNVFQASDSSPAPSSSQGCAKYSIIASSSIEGEATSPAPPLSASSIPFYNSSLRNSSRSLHSSVIPANNLKKQHAAIKTSSLSGHAGVTAPVALSLPGATSEDDFATHECPLCLLELPFLCYPRLRTCSHRACFDCLQQYLKIEISESRVMVTCPECTELIHPNDIRFILNDELYTEKYERFMLRRVLIAEADARWCPAPDCGYVVIATGCAGCPKLQCERPGCYTEFCYHCKQIWHPNLTCDAARAQRFNINGDILITTPGATAPNGDAIIVVDGIVTSRHAKDSEIKNCPHCRVLIIKMDDGSCNHMTCSVCGTEFCWLCMKRITDLHYLSPSGCTFWGKKPWSRKKKILWQLGMLVGAPVGIALLAGIAVPAIIIGIPVWVGRKLHARFQKRETMSQKNKHMMLATGVIASVCVSPILALVAVGIGIPILLAYVYGVVPISLCRSGGCNVNTSSSGVRIDMNEESEETTGEKNSRGAADGLSVDTAVSNKVNPSIGEVSLGMSASLSMGSGSHLDRVTVDRESVSNVPLTGSIYSATASNKLEVTVDVSSNKRFSFSSHSESASCGISLSERVSNSGALDDGTSSTLGLAGSITGHT